MQLSTNGESENRSPGKADGSGSRTCPKRVALVTEYYYPHLGGICEHVHFFAAEMRKRGHHVDIITSNIPGADKEDHVIRLGRSQPVYANGSLARITIGRGLRKDVRDVLRAGNYDIVHVHSPLTPTLPILAIEESDCPIVGTFHTYFDSSLGYLIGRSYFQERLNRLSAAIAVSYSTTVALRKYFDADWQIIPNGIDLELFSPDAPAPVPNTPLFSDTLPDWNGDVPIILFLGRFDPRNGLDTLIDCFKMVRGGSRKCKLVVVGDGPLRKKYYKAAGNDKDIHFAGAVLDGRPSYYAHSSIYACPTTKASFGITLLESMACETPIVCSDILGFRDVVQHKREAWMYHCGDKNALCDALVHLLDDEALREKLGKTGREEARQYGWSSVTDMVIDVYKEVLGEKK